MTAPASSDADPFQQVWLDPASAHAVYVDHENGFMVVPDARPVMPNHLLVVTRDLLSYEELPHARRRAMDELVDVTYEHMTAVLHPQRKILVARWGNQVRTAHIHLVPRNAKEDATVWKGAPATPEELEATRTLLAFPPQLQQEAARRVGNILQALSESVR